MARRTKDQLLDELEVARRRLAEAQARVQVLERGITTRNDMIRRAEREMDRTLGRALLDDLAALERDEAST